MHRWVVVASVCAVGAVGCAGVAEPPPLWGTLETGSFGVGFRSLVAHDTTRGALEASGRAVEFHLWYPTRERRGPRMTLRDYVRQEKGADIPEDSIRRWLASAVSGSRTGIPDTTLATILDSPMQASLEADFMGGRFPMVLWTMRHETVPAQSVLSEYLASHGYVVASARFVGPRLPYPWEMETVAERMRVFETHLTDLSFTLTMLAQHPSVDSARVAILTWSYAAELAPRIQLLHENVDVVIGLSSNPLSGSGPYQGQVAAAALIPEHLQATYIVMTESVGPDGMPRVPARIMEELPSESFFVSFRDLAHGNFNVLEGMIPGVFGLAEVQPWSKGGDVAREGYETISRYVLGFLDRQIGTGPVEPLASQPWAREEPRGPVTTTRFVR